MPELPEVETVALFLQSKIQGRKVVHLVVNDKKLSEFRENELRGKVIEQVFRNGKQVVFRLSGSTLLWIHLRMTGRLFWFSTVPKNVNYERMRLILDSGCIVFSDQRRFGTLKVSSTLQEHACLGLDPLSSAFTTRELSRLVSKSAMAIKPWLLRQDKLVGIGNIYANETLFRAGINPARKANTLSKLEVKALHRAIGHVLRKAITYGGTTFINFANPEGSKGGFAKELTVYGRDEEPCSRCCANIVRTVQQGRSTYYCPKCQH